MSVAIWKLYPWAAAMSAGSCQPRVVCVTTLTFSMSVRFHSEAAPLSCCEEVGTMLVNEERFVFHPMRKRACKKATGRRAGGVKTLPSGDSPNTMSDVSKPCTVGHGIHIRLGATSSSPGAIDTWHSFIIRRFLPSSPFTLVDNFFRFASNSASSQ